MLGKHLLAIDCPIAWIVVLYRTKFPRLSKLAPLFGFLLCLAGPVAQAGVVNIYTERQQVFLEPILTEFSEVTGHDVEVLYLDSGVAVRLLAEGKASPADVVIVADIGRLQQLVIDGLTQPISSTTVNASVPAHLRDPDDNWVALTKRLRVIYVAKDATDQPSSFEELAEKRWRGKVCLRSGTHPYNVALFSALLDHHGQESFVDWLRKLKDNLARKPQGNDRAQIKGVANGGCVIGIGNLYYYYKMLNSNDPDEREAAAKVRWVPASVAGNGAHANVSGIALAKHAPNRSAAMELIEFMVGPVAQRIYATANSELPVRPGTTMPPELQEAANVPIDDIPLHRIAAQRALVSELVDRTGFDN